MQAKVNHAAALITEDHLKKVCSKTQGKHFKTSDNKLLPRAQHSAFGDFPKGYINKQQQRVEPLAALDTLECSGAATKTGK